MALQASLVCWSEFAAAESLPPTHRQTNTQTHSWEIHTNRTQGHREQRRELTSGRNQPTQTYRNNAAHKYYIYIYKYGIYEINTRKYSSTHNTIIKIPFLLSLIKWIYFIFINASIVFTLKGNSHFWKLLAPR